MVPIATMLGAIEEKWIERKILPLLKEGKDVRVFHTAMVAVAHGYTRMKLATRILAAATRLAKEKGFTFAIAEATVYGSQLAFRSLGYQTDEEFRMAYESFQMADGSRPFKGCVEPSHCHLVELNLHESKIQ